MTGVLMAIFMSNAGGAWDNAKKYVEEGRSTPGKRSANDTGNSWKQIEIFMQ